MTALVAARRRPDLFAIGAFLLAALVYGAYGFDNKLLRDDAAYVYSGQRLVAGDAPYESIYDLKGPVVHLLMGVGVGGARVLGLDDLSGVRLWFFLISCATVAAVYLLGRELHSRRAGLLAAATFVGFYGFALHAASGPRAKTPVVLFMVLALLFTARRRWFLAGAAGALAALTWQPTGLVALATLYLAWRQPDRRTAVGRLIAGAAIPVAVVVAIFVALGAFGALFEATVLDVLEFRAGATGKRSLADRLTDPVQAVRAGYAQLAAPIVLGFSVIAAAYAWRRAVAGSWSAAFARDPWAVVLLTFPAPFLWSLVDFQTYPDFYPFLPYAALGFGVLLALASGGEALAKIHRHAPAALVATLVTALALLALSIATPARGNALSRQRAGADGIVAAFGADTRMVSVGAPELLVLLERPNPNRYPYVVSFVDKAIDRKTPGGFRAWVDELADFDADVVLSGRTDGALIEPLERYLAENFTPREFPPWTVLVRDRP